MVLEKLMPSSTLRSRKVVNHSTQAYPKRVWVIVLATDCHVLQQVPILLAFTFPVSVRMLASNFDPSNWTCCAWKMSKRPTPLLVLHIQVIGLESQFTVTWHFPQTRASKALIPTKWQLPSQDRPDEQRCHNHVFAPDWRLEIASNGVLVIKFHVLWHL